MTSKDDRSSVGFGAGLPVQHIETKLVWSDLIVPSETLSQLEDIADWLKNRQRTPIVKDPGRGAKPGFRALFHGPPGTGKNLAATLLGKKVGQEVHRVDVSQLLSKWIAETERNLALLFDRAEKQGAILLFDEADSLFGKRTEIAAASDRFAKQEVSYLLERIEEFSGLVVLSTTTKIIDPAIARRFQAVVHFPEPDASGRAQR